MVSTPPFQSSDDQYNVENPQIEVDAIVETPDSDADIDLEFLYTRDIEFRQETIYFLVVDRFHDGNPKNNKGFNSELYYPDRQEWGKYWGGDLHSYCLDIIYLHCCFGIKPNPNNQH